MKKREAQIPAAAKVRLTEAVHQLFDLYTAWDKRAEAAKWRDELEGLTPDSNADAIPAAATAKE
jgi:hypothetical protein